MSKTKIADRRVDTESVRDVLQATEEAFAGGCGPVAALYAACGGARNLDAPLLNAVRAEIGEHLSDQECIVYDGACRHFGCFVASNPPPEQVTGVLRAARDGAQ